jgi:hypothetical protein
MIARRDVLKKTGSRNDNIRLLLKELFKEDKEFLIPPEWPIFWEGIIMNNFPGWESGDRDSLVSIFLPRSVFWKTGGKDMNINPLDSRDVLLNSSLCDSSPPVCGG